MEPITHLERAVAEATRIVDGVADDQLSSPTPCEEWDVRALLAHLLGGTIMFTAAARERSVPQPVMDEIMRGPELVGDDFRERMRTEGQAMVEAFRGVTHDKLELPFGTLPTPVVVTIAALDAAIHGADLAHATGQSFDDAELAEASLEIARRQEKASGGMMRSPNVFGPEHPCTEDAPAATRLLAFAGRKVG